VSTGSPAPDLLGLKGGYFTSEADAHVFREHRYMPAMQMVAPNSPQWFNTGLHWAYGIDGPSQGHFYVDFVNRQAHVSRPPTSIRSRMPVSSSDLHDLVNEGGTDLWVRGAAVQIRLGHRHEFLQAPR
jgi:ribonucleoside-diphosphate reductase alpha chain